MAQKLRNLKRAQTFRNLGRAQNLRILEGPRMRNLEVAIIWGISGI